MFRNYLLTIAFFINKTTLSLLISNKSYSKSSILFSRFNPFNKSSINKQNYKYISVYSMNNNQNSDLNEISYDDTSVDTSIIPWQQRIERSIAISRKIKGGNYIQLATVDSNNRPHVRTVVFRGFNNINNNQCLRIITDERSDKISHLSYSNECEIVWWFSKSSEQYRIYGKIQIIHENDSDSNLVSIRKQQWGNLSDPAREQFYWNHPGVSYNGLENDNNKLTGRDSDGNILPVPPNFTILLLHPIEVKYLRLRDNYSQNDKQVNNQWIHERVNP